MLKIPVVLFMVAIIAALVGFTGNVGELMHTEKTKPLRGGTLSPRPAVLPAGSTAKKKEEESYY
jgi:hypothetical protein